VLHYLQVGPDIATRTFHTGIDPFTKKPVNTAKHLVDRKLQRVKT
jgi:hypothetical protein